MKILIVWVVLSLSPKLHLHGYTNLKFPTQADCQRFAIALKHNYQQTHHKALPAHALTCTKTKIVVPITS